MAEPEKGILIILTELAVATLKDADVRFFETHDKVAALNWGRE